MLQSINLLPVNILQIVFACQIGFIALVIWNQKRYRSLAVFFVFQAVLSGMNVLEGINATRQYYLVTPAFTLLIGPILYFFIRSLVNDIVLTTREKAAHFMLALFALPFTQYTQLIIAVGTLSQVVYLLISFRLIARYHATSKAVSSDADRYKLTWLVRALAVFTAATIIDLIRMNLQTITPINVKELWYFANELIFFTLSCYLAFNVIRQPLLFDGMTSYEELDDHKSSDDKKAEKALATNIFTSIESQIIENEMFKKPRLTVTDLADSTGINVKDISWAINLGSNRNFCDYINSLRIEDVKQKLLSGKSDSTSVLEIALASGFNSKSTFNAVFKKELGKTPSQFIQENLKLNVRP